MARTCRRHVLGMRICQLKNRPRAVGRGFRIADRAIACLNFALLLGWECEPRVDLTMTLRPMGSRVFRVVTCSFVAVVFAACSSAQGGVAPLATTVVSESSQAVTIPAGGGQVRLPATKSDQVVASFASISNQLSVAVSAFDGLGISPPTKNIWSSCPFPLEQLQFVFPISLALPSTPTITITTMRLQDQPAYYYAEWFDADTSPVTFFADATVSASSSWPANTVVLPAITTLWQVISGHRYVLEVVESSATPQSCTGTYS